MDERGGRLVEISDPGGVGVWGICGIRNEKRISIQMRYGWCEMTRLWLA